MRELLVNFLKKCVEFDYAELNSIVPLFKEKQVKRNEIIIASGDVCNEFYFVGKGCLRVFFLNSKGNEKTNHIALENTIISAMSSFITQKPSYEMVDALEDSELLVINRKDFYDLVGSSRTWGAFYRLTLETAYLTKVQRIESRVTLTARERFNLVLRENPEFFQRVSNRILASYIDVTQETLSRMKS